MHQSGEHPSNILDNRNKPVIQRPIAWLVGEQAPGCASGDGLARWRVLLGLPGAAPTAPVTMSPPRKPSTSPA